MEGYNTIREATAPDKLNHCTAWIRAGVHANKINVLKVHNRLWVISDEEVERIRANPITITPEEYTPNRKRV